MEVNVVCIYVDVLIVLNWYVNYFILLGTAKVTHMGFNRKKLVLSAFVGAWFSLVILLPTMNYLLSIVVKFLMSNVLIAIAFRWEGVPQNLKMSLYFSTISFMFAGIMLALESVIGGGNFSQNNGVVYANFSIGFLVVATALSYIVLCICKRLIDRNTAHLDGWYLTITYDGKVLKLNGLADTGNSLVDVFSGKPVVVCSKSTLSTLIDIQRFEITHGSDLKGFRLIPYSTIGTGGVIVSFKPDSVTIDNLTDGSSKPVDVLIGISGECEKAIFNPKILV
jgi:stage II sporulation protein GA (sporulation sigma-E factor processing peptidase)